jgi:membrane fusion protein, multidrug efflux system
MRIHQSHLPPLLPALACMGTFFLLAGCASDAQQKAQGPPPPPPVDVVQVSATDVPIVADYPAQTYARNTVDVRARVEGYVERWLFAPGSTVVAGQPLYVLDLRPLEAVVIQAEGNLHQSEADLEFAKGQVSLLQAEANLASAKANLEKARQDLERLKPLVAQDAASKQDLDAAVAAQSSNESNVRALQAAVDQARLQTTTQIKGNQGKVESLRGTLATSRLNLEYGTITAPITGVVGDTIIPVGGLANPAATQPLTTIVPLDPIWVRFKVTEEQYLAMASGKLNSVRNDPPITLVLADNSTFPNKGKIENTTNQVDPRTGTLEMQARFPNPKRTLLPGQFGRVQVQTQIAKNVVLIPQRAVQQVQNLRSVFTVEAGDKIAVRPITTGARIGENWIVESGLQPGDRVVVEGLMRVRPGIVVKPRPWQSSKPGTDGAPPAASGAGAGGSE